MAKNEPSTNDSTSSDKAAATAVAGVSTKGAPGMPQTAETAANLQDAAAAGAGDGAKVQESNASAAQAGASTQSTSAEAPSSAHVPTADTRPIAIEVISRVDGFYRANRQWTIQPQTVRLGDLSEQQVREIEQEPLLITRWLRAGDR
jgi:hypothetical protein